MVKTYTASGRRLYGFKNEEYMADFMNVAKRVLGQDTLLHKIFCWHYLLGADFRAVNRKLGRAPDDRQIYHEFYRVEERLGRAFGELKPYPLYPLDEYFGGLVKGNKREKYLPELGTRDRKLRFPLKAAAA